MFIEFDIPLDIILPEKVNAACTAAIDAGYSVLVLNQNCSLDDIPTLQPLPVTLTDPRLTTPTGISCPVGNAALDLLTGCTKAKIIRRVTLDVPAGTNQLPRSLAPLSAFDVVVLQIHDPATVLAASKWPETDAIIMTDNSRPSFKAAAELDRVGIPWIISTATFGEEGRLSQIAPAWIAQQVVRVARGRNFILSGGAETIVGPYERIELVRQAVTTLRQRDAVRGLTEVPLRAIQRGIVRRAGLGAVVKINEA